MSDHTPPCRDLAVSWFMGNPRSIHGPVYRMKTLPVGATGTYGKITKYTSDWARVAYERLGCATMLNPRQSGHEIEGRVELDGRILSAFTSGGDNPHGGTGMIIVRDRKKGGRREV